MKARFVRVIASLMLCSGVVACATAQPRALTPSPRSEILIVSSNPSNSPTLEDFWNGAAHFRLESTTTGLPMGESDTINPVEDDSESHPLWSYVHASFPSLGVVDLCGMPVDFPGCVVMFQGDASGSSFTPRRNADGQVTCLIECNRCPCSSKRDHVDKQQYPRIAIVRPPKHATSPVPTTSGSNSPLWLMVYEYRANIFLRKSQDGIHWGQAEEVPVTGIWQQWLMGCRTEERIAPHPHARRHYDCLIGSPPGIFVDTSQNPPELYIFVGLGQNPGAMGCYRGSPYSPAALLRKCDHNPLFVGAADYGPVDAVGPETNPYFDFRTVSSADVMQIGNRYYMLYEGVRGPAPAAAGDTQFALGLARSKTSEIDGPWEVYPGNPILVDLPGNVGVGHADLLIQDGQTTLFTSLDGETRSRLVLRWLP